jgi:FlaA1/EpsC-like NDP-sugar epimerase
MSPNFQRRIFQRVARLFDVTAVSLTFVAAVAVSSGDVSWPTLSEFLAIRIKVENILIFAGYLFLCSAIFSACGFYLSHRLSRWTRQACEISVATTLITIVFSLLPRGMPFATKEFLLLFWLMNFWILFLPRLIGYHVLYFARTHGRNLRNIVIVGEGSDASALAERIQKQTTLGYRVVQVINTEEAKNVGL